jgi:hypothetical protein
MNIKRFVHENMYQHKQREVREQEPMSVSMNNMQIKVCGNGKMIDDAKKAVRM